MDTNKWLNFSLSENPNIDCPRCKVGRLNIVDHFQVSIDGPSQRDKYCEYWDRTSKFSGLLKCSNGSCSEVYSVSGKTIILADPVHDEYGNLENVNFCDIYDPEFISPPFEIIELKNEYPTTVKAALNDSFKLFFADNEACANKIRIALELLLDELGVTQLNKKGVDLALGIRIAEYEERDEKNAKLMKATKIIGNFGSHRKKIERKDVLDGYELLKAVLDDLYDNESEKLKLKAEQINSQNKPISKIGK